MALYNLDRLDEAVNELSLASTLAPNDADPFYRLGLVASEKRDTKAALTYWTKALDLKPTFPEVNFMIGEELLKNQLFEKSVPFYEHALEQSQGPACLLSPAQGCECSCTALRAGNGSVHESPRPLSE